MPAQAGARGDYVVPAEPSDWVFNGEFWQDELGQRRHVSQSTCL
ncbi:MAG: hypothetical protein ACI9MC_000563 [Kiritimatiellia bacterium]|jgi:hypothetical protein